MNILKIKKTNSTVYSLTAGNTALNIAFIFLLTHIVESKKDIRQHFCVSFFFFFSSFRILE